MPVYRRIQLITSNFTLPEDPYTYNLNEKYGHDVNQKLAQVTISKYYKENNSIQYYKIFSQGQTPEGGETTITAFINFFDPGSFTKHAFTSPETLDFKSGNGGSMTGGAQLPSGRTGNGYIDLINYEPLLGWPTNDYFADFYLDQVDGASGITSGTITVAKNTDLTYGPILQSGDLSINPQGEGSLTMEGTWYIRET
jgi:hypothetical protein